MRLDDIKVDSMVIVEAVAITDGLIERFWADIELHFPAPKPSELGIPLALPKKNPILVDCAESTRQQ